MTRYIFDLVIIVFFSYEAIMLLVKRNGGSEKKLAETYTPESLNTYSLATGITLIFVVIAEIFMVLNKMGVLNFIDPENDGIVNYLLFLSPVILAVIALLVFRFTLLKKRDDYEAPSKKKDNDDEEF
ncbi:MAG: hypothetical protein K5644_08865 [Lachnospiraceae bacterium]|nr:hypothetical protein [Lachnospiraceae bacterium]